MKTLLRILLISVIVLMVSCKKCSDFRSLNISAANWQNVDPFEAHEMLMDDLDLLIRTYQENPNITLPEDEMQTFSERMLENFRFFRPGEGSDLTSPLTSKGSPLTLTEEESREKMQLLLTWTEGKLLQFHAQPLNEKTEACFNMLGLHADLAGVASILQVDTKPATATQAVILLAIRMRLTDWECKGEAELYWWKFRDKPSLLYMTHRDAIIFYENSLGKIEVLYCLNIGYYRNRKENGGDRYPQPPAV